MRRAVAWIAFEVDDAVTPEILHAVLKTVLRVFAVQHDLAQKFKVIGLRVKPFDKSVDIVELEKP